MRRKTLLSTVSLLFLAALIGASGLGSEVVELGDLRELFLDNYLLESLKNARLELHHPQPAEIAITHDQPWEGNVTTYHTVFKDGDLYRMYYNGAHFAFDGWEKTRPQHHEFTCYAESRDGIHWNKPLLGLVQYQGSKANNIILDNKWTHCFAPFLDANPACRPEEKYKAVSFCHGINGLYAFKSADGLHWTTMGEKPIVTEGKFDSQNLAFWDSFRQRYVEFHRSSDGSTRAISTSNSQDLLSWGAPQPLQYGSSPKEHMYTNAIIAYPRAPQLFLGFPMRFVDRRHRGNLIPGICDGVFMTSRDGVDFHRWEEAFIRPGLNRNRWYNRCNMTAWGILETESMTPGAPRELSLYSSEGYSEATEVCLRRYTLRLDGFVSVRAGASQGEALTRPLRFSATPESARRPRPQDTIRGTIRRDAGSRLSGKKSLWVKEPTIIEIPGSQDLGKSVTFAVRTFALSGQRRRIFSANDGGKVTAERKTFVFEINQVSDADKSYLRFWYSGGQRVEVPGDKLQAAMASGKVHHLAATWDDGEIKIYIDGREAASGGVKGMGGMHFDLGNLRFGEDYPPAGLLDNAFIGYADDILVLKRALGPDEIARMAAGGAEEMLDPARERGILYTMEDDGQRLKDRLRLDGAQDSRFPASERIWADTMLLLNVSTSAAGSLRCEILDKEGQTLPGYSAADCDPICDDGVEIPVSWRGKPELSQFAGRTLRLRFLLQDADLYAMRFGQPEE